VPILLGILIAFLFAVIVALTMVASIIATPGAGDDAAQIVEGMPESAVPDELGGESGSGGAQLVCVYLPGVSLPRTAALERRVARRYLAVKQRLDRNGVGNLTMTWGFRTTCQQINVDAGPNLKAKPGTSPHEAGRAVDVTGMRWRPDRAAIVAAFRDEGFRWLGMADPPHFEVPAEELGYESRRQMIVEAQTAFQSGEPIGGCRGSECGR